MKISLYPKYLIRSLFVHGKHRFFKAGYKVLYPEYRRHGMTPWQHYVVDGHRKGFDNGNHPSEEAFFGQGYEVEYPDVKSNGVNPWHHYAEKGLDEGRDNGLHPDGRIFFPEGYLEMYPDAAGSGMDPWHHYVLRGKKEGRDNGLHPDGRTFFPEGYLEMYPDAAGSGMDPWHHYVLTGRKEGRDNGLHPNENVFCTDGYLEMNQDIARLGVDPWRHYVLYGKKEGRLCCSINDLKIYKGREKNRTKENILVVGHEASRTGAPILTLNIIKSLNRIYNVYTLCLSNGDILDDLVNNSCCTVVLDQRYRFSFAAIKRYFDYSFGTYKFCCAIVNSAAASFFLRVSFLNDIPSLLLVHEFSYIFADLGSSAPIDFYNNFTFADNIVFSSETIKRSFLNHFGKLPYSTTVIPQGDPKILTDNQVLDKSEEVWKNLIKDRSKKYKIVAGLGTRQYRKGTDLFLLTAGEILKKTDNVFFVWIGSPSGETTIQSTIDFEIDSFNLRNNFVFIPNLKCLNEVFPYFDLVLLTSRMDPLPNVIIGSMRNGIPFVSFDDISGICDILKNNNLEDHCLVKYLDCYDLAEKASNLLIDKKLYSKVSADLLHIYGQIFSFDSYIEKLLGEIRFAESNHAALLKSAESIVNKKFLYMDTSSKTSAKIGLQYVLNCEVKPYPGFLPIMDTANRSIKDFGLILEQKFNYQSMDGLKMPSGKVSSQVAIHIHAYYLDELYDILKRLKLNKCYQRIFYLVSTTSDNFDAVRNIFAENNLRCTVRISENKGRDYGPFFTLFNDCISTFPIIGHIHTKKSIGIDRQIIDLWKDSMLSSLIGFKDQDDEVNMLDRNLVYMEEHSDIGMLLPDDPNICGWNLNRCAAENLVRRLGVDIPNITSAGQFVFPVGSMFLARYKAIKEFFALTNEDFPPEPVPYDGTILHAIERVLPFVSKANNFKNVCVFNEKHSRIKYNN